MQYHSEQNRVFLFKCYWYDITDRGIRVDPHYGLVEINLKARHRNVNDVFVFAKQRQQVYYTYTPSFRNDQSRVDWLSVLKTKPRQIQCVRALTHNYRRICRRTSKNMEGFSKFLVRTSIKYRRQITDRI